MKVPRILIAGTGSGSGKTTLACGILSALKQRGMRLSACKCGPDYIDPMFYRALLGIPSRNLDSFFSGRDFILHQLTHGIYDLTLIEGVMGYYDGMRIGGTAGSSYEIAAETGTPAVLMLPCHGMAYTAAALVGGMASFRHDSHIRGVILNNTSTSAYSRLKPAIENDTGIPVLGYLPFNKEYSLNSRRLGLVMPSEISDIERKLNAIGKTVSKTVDLDGILALAESAPEIAVTPYKKKEAVKPDVKIGIAKDKAFCFYYTENFELLRSLGCELVEFSPLSDTCLPDGISGLILGGGYPELYAKQLSENTAMLGSVKQALKNGLPCLAECGGFLYLHRIMEGEDGNKYPMAGIIDAEAFRTEKLQRFGYITLEAENCDNPFFAGRIRGHEFHYWDSTDSGMSAAAENTSGKRWHCMHVTDTLCAGFPHLYYPSNPEFAARFVSLCRRAHR